MPRNPLHEVHVELGAFLMERAGTPLPARFSDTSLEHRAVRSSVGIFDLTSAGKIRITGAERLRFLNGLLAADLRPLQPGLGCYSLILTRDGHIASDVRVAVSEDSVLVLTPPICRAKVFKLFERHVVSSDVVVTDVTESVVLMSAQGPRARDVIATLLEAPVPEMEPFGIVEIGSPLGPLALIRSPRTGGDGYDVLVRAADAPTWFRHLVTAAKSFSGLPCGFDALESLRVESGRPAFGTEMDETSRPCDVSEASVTMGGLCMDKGCFLGREAVGAAAAHTPPAVRLAGIVFGSSVPPVRGDKLLLDGRPVGKLTTAVYSPSLDRGIALAMIEPSAAEPGRELRSADGDAATVVALPFPSAAANA